MPHSITLIFGAMVGSFLNVCIVRIPQGTSIVQPPSHCPGCKARFRFYNVPLISTCCSSGGAAIRAWAVAAQRLARSSNRRRISFGLALGLRNVHRRRRMGGGDIRLLVMIGAFLGWPSIPVLWPKIECGEELSLSQEKRGLWIANMLW